MRESAMMSSLQSPSDGRRAGQKALATLEAMTPTVDGCLSELTKEVQELLEQFKLMATTMQKTMKKNKKMGKGGMDLHNMDAATVAQMMHKMNPQMLAHLGGQQGLEQMMAEMEKEEKKIGGGKGRK